MDNVGGEEELYKKYQCLGVVQTPGRTGREGSDQGMRFNVIHSADSTSTINTGDEVIHPNDLIIWEFPHRDHPIEYGHKLGPHVRYGRSP